MTTSPSHPSTLFTFSPSTNPYPSFLLFGDSITQGSNTTLLARLSDYYTRRLDILNRGLSGYNAPSALYYLPSIFPSIAPSPSHPRVRLMTVFFGANDATIPGDPQHVSLHDYRDALRQIALHDGVHLHRTKIIFIVPAPVDEWQLELPNRTAAHTALYAGACREVATELDVPMLDLWTIFMKMAGWDSEKDDMDLIGSRDAPPSQVLRELLSDGLHFTEKAYGIMYDELVELIEKKLLDDVPEKIPMALPDWKAVMGVE